MVIEWLSIHGGKISISIENATKLLKEWDDEWPGGLDEASAAWNNWRNRAIAAEEKLEKIRNTL